MVFLGCIFSEVIVSYNHAALLMFQEYCNCLPYFIGGCRRNSLWINPSLTGMNPVSAM
jgi:hypothetical protein